MPKKSMGKKCKWGDTEFRMPFPWSGSITVESETAFSGDDFISKSKNFMIFGLVSGEDVVWMMWAKVPWVVKVTTQHTKLKKSSKRWNGNFMFCMAEMHLCLTDRQDKEGYFLCFRTAYKISFAVCCCCCRGSNRQDSPIVRSCLGQINNNNTNDIKLSSDHKPVPFITTSLPTSEYMRMRMRMRCGSL